MPTLVEATVIDCYCFEMPLVGKRVKGLKLKLLLRKTY